VGTKEIDRRLETNMRGVKLRYGWIHFPWIGIDNDHVRFLIQSMPEHRVSKILRARRILAEKAVAVCGEFCCGGYFTATVRKFTSEDIVSACRPEALKENTLGLALRIIY